MSQITITSNLKKITVTKGLLAVLAWFDLPSNVNCITTRTQKTKVKL